MARIRKFHVNFVMWTCIAHQLPAVRHTVHTHLVQWESHASVLSRVIQCCAESPHGFLFFQYLFLSKIVAQLKHTLTHTHIYAVFMSYGMRGVLFVLWISILYSCMSFFLYSWSSLDVHKSCSSPFFLLLFFNRYILFVSIHTASSLSLWVPKVKKQKMKRKQTYGHVFYVTCVSIILTLWSWCCLFNLNDVAEKKQLQPQSPFPYTKYRFEIQNIGP